MKRIILLTVFFFIFSSCVTDNPKKLGSRRFSKTYVKRLEKAR
jgi:hypothetical protein